MNPNNLPLKSTVLKSFCYNVCSHLPTCNNGDNGESCHFSTAVSVEYIVATNQRKRLKPGIFLEKKKKQLPMIFTMVSLSSQSSELVCEHTCVPLSADSERETISLHLKNDTKRGEWGVANLSGRILQGTGQELLSQIIADL